PGQMVTRYKPDAGPLMDALQACAQSIGYDVRYQWWEPTQSFELVLIKPDREKEEPDHTFGPTNYIDVNQLRISRSEVRNRWQVVYHDATTQQVERVTVEDPASQERYGVRFARITEGEDSPIDTGPEAIALAEYAL